LPLSQHRPLKKSLQIILKHKWLHSISSSVTGFVLTFYSRKHRLL